MRLLSVDKNAAMWNDCFKEHASREDTCILPLFEVHKKKFGLCWQQSLSCTACHYKSRMYKLYSEVNTGSRGQKPCAPNVAIHVGLQDTTMGNTVEQLGQLTRPYHLNFCIPPYGVNGRTRGMALWCTGHFLFYSAIRCKWSVYNLWPYGVQGIFICLIPPYGVNGRFMIFGPMVYRAFFLFVFRHTV